MDNLHARNKKTKKTAPSVMTYFMLAEAFLKVFHHNSEEVNLGILRAVNTIIVCSH